VNGADFPTDGSCLLAAPHNLAIRLCLDPLAFPLRLVALGVRTFNLCLLALGLVLALDRRVLCPDHSIQVPNRIPVCQSKPDKRTSSRKWVGYCSPGFYLCYACYRGKEIPCSAHTPGQRDMHIFSPGTLQVRRRRTQASITRTVTVRLHDRSISPSNR